MAGINIYQDSYIGATIISNRFIDEYMKDANDAQLKVYLYLLRMLNAHLQTDISDIADRFNHTEKDVMRALEYWEKRGLVCLDKDENDKLVGIRMKNLCHGENTGETIEETHAPAPATAPAQLSYIKPNYSADQIKNFREDSSSSNLIMLAEAYLARPLSQADLNSLVFIRDVLGFSDDLADHLLQYCVGRGKRDFRYIEKVAISWKEQGITTPEEAEENISRYNGEVYSIMNGLGKKGNPTDIEIEYIRRWTDEYGFTQDIILEACNRTVLATDTNRFNYAESILRRWKEKNVRHKSDIDVLDKEHEKKAEKAASSGRQQADKPKYGAMMQNAIDFDEFEKKVLKE